MTVAAWISLVGIVGILGCVAWSVVDAWWRGGGKATARRWLAWWLAPADRRSFGRRTAEQASSAASVGPGVIAHSEGVFGAEALDVVSGALGAELRLKIPSEVVGALWLLGEGLSSNECEDLYWLAVRTPVNLTLREVSLLSRALRWRVALDVVRRPANQSRW